MTKSQITDLAAFATMVAFISVLTLIVSIA